MDWIIAIATGIAVLRLCLISCGMWILLRSTARPGVYLDYQRKCFTAAGVIYLLGLMPQSLLLLLVNSNLANLVLDNGYLCWAQNFACMIATALHSVVLLKWIVDCILCRSKHQGNYLMSVLKHKVLGYFLIAYAAVFILCRSFFLRDDSGNEYYADVAAQTTDASVGHWTTSAVQHPTQIVRLQLLLCECSLSEGKTLGYLAASYSFLILPFLMLCILGIQRLRLRELESTTKNPDENTEPEVQPTPWWEQEINIQRLLSASIAVWIHLIQPIIFSIHSEHFVDFGSHLLLTICVFIPWTHSDVEYNPIQSWV